MGLLWQVPFEPPGPSMLAANVVLALVGHPPVPVQLFAFQLPVAVGVIRGCLPVSMTPDPVRLRLQIAEPAWRLAANAHVGGVNFGAEAVQDELPSGPFTVAVNDVPKVWLQVTVLLAGEFPSQVKVLPRTLKLDMVPGGDVLDSV